MCDCFIYVGGCMVSKSLLVPVIYGIRPGEVTIHHRLRLIKSFYKSTDWRFTGMPFHSFPCDYFLIKAFQFEVSFDAFPDTDL